MENITNPGVLCNEMAERELLNSNQLNIILNAPTDYMRSLYVFEHVYNMNLDELFEFVDILKGNNDYKHMGDELIKGINVHVTYMYVTSTSFLSPEGGHTCAHTHARTHTRARIHTTQKNTTIKTFTLHTY